jgi:uncharacterized membrane protein (DUF106 family)
MHEYIPVVVTLIAIFAGILMNKADLRELKADMKDYKTDMNARFSDLKAYMDVRFERLEAKQDRMQADLSEFHRVLGQHDKAIEILEKRK